MPVKEKYDKYRYAKNFSVPKRFPYDPKYSEIKKKLFKKNGNGWWVKPRVECVNIPIYWCRTRGEIIERNNYKR